MVRKTAERKSGCGPGHGGDECSAQADPRERWARSAIAADVLNRMLELGRPEYIRIA